MQVNNSNFAQTYQTIRHAQVINEKPTSITPEQKNNVADALASKLNTMQQAQFDNAQQKRTAATTLVDYRQTKENLETYTQSYQSATGSHDGTSVDQLSYSDIKDINQAMTRYQVANSNMLRTYIDRTQDNPIPTPYYQTEQLNQAQAGTMINTFA